MISNRLSFLPSRWRARARVTLQAALCLLAAGSAAQAQSVGPTLNLSRTAGNQYETSVAIDPNSADNIFVVGRNEVGGLAVSRSSDGGVTWTSKLIARSSVPATGDVPRAYGNATVAWDMFGNLFLAYLSQASSTASPYVTLALSTDGGATFHSPTGVGPAILLPGGNLPVFGDQPTVAVGPGSAGYAASVWVTYWSAGGIYVSGAGVSGAGVVSAFSTQMPIQPSAVNFGDVAVGPNGEVSVAYGPNGNGAGVLYTNLDPDGLGPAPFGPYVAAATVNVGGFTYLPVQPNWGIDPEAGLAFDRSGGPNNGRLYMVYTDSSVASPADTNIFVIHSDDQGTTWSAPVRVNDDPGTNSQFLPHLSLDQSNGMLGVTWHDARNSATNATAQYVGAFSDDGGGTFQANFVIGSGVSDQAASVAALKKTDFGDYTGNAFVNGRLVPAWADNSNSTGDNPDGATNFDIYTAVVQAPAPVPPPVTCAATDATATFVNKWWLDVVLKAGDPVTHVVYTATPAGTTFAGVSGFAVGQLIDFSGTLDAVSMCHASTMTVRPAPPAMTIAPATLTPGKVGVAYSAAISVSGGLAPTTVVSVSGLPAGLSWNGTAIVGTPTTPGSSAVAVTAADARGLVQSVNLTLTIQAAASYTIPDQGNGRITAVGDHVIRVGAKSIAWDTATKLSVKGGRIAVGMTAEWKGKRDAVTGIVLASQLTVDK